ncbi:MAG: AAA family ATPase [Sandaracinaceae bacterium]
MLHDDEMLLACLREPQAALPYALSLAVRRARPGKALFETEDMLFDFVSHAKEGRAELRVTDGVHPQYDYHWTGREEPIGEAPRLASFDIRWRGVRFEMLQATYAMGYGVISRYFLVADEHARAVDYFTEVCEHSAELRDRILVYANGCWSTSKELYASVARTSFDDIILAEPLGRSIRSDFDRFLRAREQYERWQVPWKRGALFLGSPGNGKTMCIRALIRELALPCIYVQGFVAPHRPPQVGIKEVFDRARRQAPCLLVLEDLDALVTPDSRSFFLNELDGFATNSGIVTIGSTNHPERLDPALLDRPSRFDRKYYFALPETADRARYIGLWNAKLADGLSLDDAAVARIAEATDGYSFAYLKELFASALMRFASEAESASPPTSLTDVLMDEASLLRDQMTKHDVVPGAGVPLTPDPRDRVLAIDY